ncbi:MAG: PHP domain-containing protein [Chloroflexi bacterium]|nr:PHP domain-containing protein [Chloroflexota bacterium]MBU1747623.1 PHP domain-containing protein [Chloroflexota bacterium]
MPLLRPILADLHLHTVLSACAEVEMIPPLIVREARRRGLGLIAVTDHNAMSNAPALMQAAEDSGVTVWPGLEVQSREEVHLLCLFDDLEPAAAMQEVVWTHLPPLQNREEFFGAQYVVDAEGEYSYTEERLLQTSTDLSVEQVAALVEQLGGLCIPAHVDRPAYSLLANLGFVPPTAGFLGLEISPLTTPDQARQRFPAIGAYLLLIGGDAHRLNEISARTLLKIESPTIAELRLALLDQDNRAVKTL